MHLRFLPLMLLSALAACLSGPPAGALRTQERPRLRIAEEKARDPAADLPSVVNFRDIGGKVTASGGFVKRGLVYRSGNFERTLPSHLQTLVERTALRRYYDLRSLSEIGEESIFAPLGVSVEHVPMDSRDDPFLHESVHTSTEWTAFYSRTLSRHALQFARLYHALAYADAPVVYTCSLGKDRTGMATALLLGALGVDEHTIVADYAATTAQVLQHVDHFEGAWQRLGISKDDFVAYYLVADPTIMRDFLHEALSEHTSYEGIMSFVGVDATTLAALRQRLTEPGNVEP